MDIYIHNIVKQLYANKTKKKTLLSKSNQIGAIQNGSQQPHVAI